MISITNTQAVVGTILGLFTIASMISAFLSKRKEEISAAKSKSDAATADAKAKSDGEIAEAKRIAELIKATRDTEIAVAKAASAQAALDRELEARKELSDAWSELNGQRATINARVDGLQETLYTQLLDAERRLGDVMQQLGAAQADIRAAKAEAQNYKDLWEHEVSVGKELMSRVKVLEDNAKKHDDTMNVTETNIVTRAPKP